LLLFFLATASDSDSDAEDGSGPNIREMQHVSFNFYNKMNASAFFFLLSTEKLPWF